MESSFCKSVYFEDKSNCSSLTRRKNAPGNKKKDKEEETKKLKEEQKEQHRTKNVKETDFELDEPALKVLSAAVEVLDTFWDMSEAERIRQRDAEQWVKAKKEHQD